jgi:putative toxin-antitoxin system antitoxin component (TIGR02293 family)
MLAPLHKETAAILQSFIVPAGTYKRRLAQGRLSPEESEKAVRFARVMATAEHVLGDADEARHFLHEPHAELEGRRPIEVAETEIGAREVEALLWKAFYGVPT